MIDLRIWSASMPLYLDGGELGLVENPRPWNGRRLSGAEVSACAAAYKDALGRGEPQGHAAQAAYEWLSQWAW